jgi:deoxyribodipyrimidine photo-lyase
MADRLFPPSRAEALRRLAHFVPKAGSAYAAGRNTDSGPDQQGAVSKLSPYLRYRLLTEQETVAEVLGRHSLTAAEKFVQEVLWRTYWKGWLEMRPEIWSRYLAGRDADRERFHDTHALADAEAGRTGIEGFDDWARELVTTGYLHNHARMWFASIWIFTLRLPWTLGADFFLRHLIDADPASNTLSWRWVAGLQTAGKTYLATADNIARYTNGRFAPKGLVKDAPALTEPPIPAPTPLSAHPIWDERAPSLLLVTHEDFHPESLFPDGSKFSNALIINDQTLLWGEGARQFVSTAAADTVARLASRFNCGVEITNTLDPETLIAAARAAGTRQILTADTPIGPVAEALSRSEPVLAREGISLVRVRRPWDSAFWPHAKRGFFAFKEQMPHLLRAGGLL